MTARLMRADEYPDVGDETRTPVVVASDQVIDALLAVERQAGDFLHMPWPALDAIVDGIAPSDVWYVAAFSGQGKTTFLSSALDEWFTAGKRIYMLGLESRPHVLRTHWAAKRCGVDAGDLLTGKVNAMPNGAAIRAAVKAELWSQCHDEKALRVYFSPVQYVNLDALDVASEHAADFGADVVIVDHVDHIRSGDGKSGFQESQAVQQRILDLAQRDGHRFLIATQLNNEAVRGDALAMYKPPRPEMVFMGGVKRQVASGMLGLYRPMRVPRGGETEKEYGAALNAVRHGQAEPQTVVEPNRMGVVVMKHRVRGANEGRRTALGVDHGRVVELDAREQDEGLTRHERRGAA